MVNHGQDGPISTVVCTVATLGRDGTLLKPNLTGGRIYASPPTSWPSQLTMAESIRRTSVTP